MYYQYQVINATTLSVEFLLTPNTGDSDIYVARTMQPSYSVYEKGSHTQELTKSPINAENRWS